ncbi:hypothetical protein G6F22_012226 [Rhizopus arrhizus]|nr:hypothetical protein G6F22_012226 [Rhizopus arrhizus]
MHAGIDEGERRRVPVVVDVAVDAAVVAHARTEAEPAQRAGGEGVVGAQRRAFLRHQRHLLAYRSGIGAAPDLGVEAGVAAVHAQALADVPAPFQLGTAHAGLALLDREQGVLRVDGERVVLLDLVRRRGQQQAATLGLVLHAGLELLAGGRHERAPRVVGTDGGLERLRPAHVGAHAIVEQVVHAHPAGEPVIALVGAAGGADALLGIGTDPVLAAGQRDQPAVDADLVLQVQAQRALRLHLARGVVGYLHRRAIHGVVGIDAGRAEQECRGVIVARATVVQPRQHRVLGTAAAEAEGQVVVDGHAFGLVQARVVVAHQLGAVRRHQAEQAQAAAAGVHFGPAVAHPSAALSLV